MEITDEGMEKASERPGGPMTYALDYISSLTMLPTNREQCTWAIMKGLGCSKNTANAILDEALERGYII